MPFDATNFEEETQLTKDLRAARALIDAPEKWVKGCMRSGGSRCIAGAIAEATGAPYANAHILGTNPRYKAANIALTDAIAVPLVLPDFNDARTTTHADIMNLFDLAIERSKASAVLAVG